MTAQLAEHHGAELLKVYLTVKVSVSLCDYRI
jgi:hypothetical protein